MDLQNLNRPTKKESANMKQCQRFRNALDEKVPTPLTLFGTDTLLLLAADSRGRVLKKWSRWW